MQYNLCVEKMNNIINSHINKVNMNICIYCENCIKGCKWIDFNIPPKGSKYDREIMSFSIKKCDDFIADYVRIYEIDIARAFGCGIHYYRLHEKELIKEVIKNGYLIRLCEGNKKAKTKKEIWIKRR